MNSVNYLSSATTRHFQKITTFVYIFSATNVWFEDVKLPSLFVKFNQPLWKCLKFFMTVFLLMQIGGLLTQDLTNKERVDAITKIILNGFGYIIAVCTLYHKKGIKELVMTLTVTLKEMFNDEKVERMMIRKNYLIQAVLCMGIVSTNISFVVEAAVHSFTSNARLTTMVPIWPDLEDRSLVAGVARVIIYIVWLVLALHVTAAYSMIITVSICLEHQFAILYEYFLSLNDIFDGDESIEIQEQKYENAVKHGIKMHCITLNCVNKLQTTCQVGFSSQIMMICSMALLMIQMMQTKQTSIEVVPIVMLSAGVLIFCGFIIWSAADITFEAQRLPTAIFHSGWHSCRGKSSVRMRKTISIAMAEAQRPVVIKGLGIIELSYESYASIVKASYSVFSVIY